MAITTYWSVSNFLEFRKSDIYTQLTPFLTNLEIRVISIANKELNANVLHVEWAKASDKQKESIEDGRLIRIKKIPRGYQFEFLCHIKNGGIKIFYEMIQGIRTINWASLRKDHVSFRSVDLSGLWIDDDLSKLDFTRANLRKCHLINANLSNTNLRGADLRGVNFTNASLENADLTDAKLSSTKFSNTNLDGAIFESIS